MLFDLSSTTNFKDLINKKQNAYHLNVDRENNKRIKYDYTIYDFILLDRGTLQRKLFPERVYSNGAPKLRRASMSNEYLSRCVPYFNSSDEGSECHDR
jgi:hypothetical protein